ncbi:MAG TPA: non-canonical purine NTP pyrophosphatase [Kofleriaceae bacterium]|jgi:hypothetical protein
MGLIFIDGNELRAAEIRRIIAGAELVVEPLQTGFATSAPEPDHKARDKVRAHHSASACFAEATDLTTLDGKSLRLELDSENENRFTKWWRETPADMQLRVAVRRAGEDAIEVVAAVCRGRIADRPAGPLALGWDRLFVPDDDPEQRTLAELAAAGELVAFRKDAYDRVAKMLGLS